MNRRNFIEKGLLGSTALLSVPTFANDLFATPKYKMGLQLYTVREDMAKDPLATLKAVKAMGYQDFEIYGFVPEQETFYGYKSSEFKNILDDLNLTTTSGHFGFSPLFHSSDDDLKRYVDKAIKGAKAIGLKYITWPWIAPELRTLANFKLMPKKLNLIGKQVTDAGLGFAYHNHGFEFEDHNGENGFDIIINETDPEVVKLQMDMYWVMHSSKKTPKELINEQPGRYVMWHIKDMDKINRDYSELGNGSIDYVDILPDPKKSGLEYYYLEQGGNFATSPLQSVADSATYFKKNLQKFL